MPIFTPSSRERGFIKLHDGW